MRKLAAIVQYLELGREEAQWLALLLALGLLALLAAGVLGLAVRLFTCAGGMTC